MLSPLGGGFQLCLCSLVIHLAECMPNGSDYYYFLAHPHIPNLFLPFMQGRIP